jgi:hypothetical protein
MTHTLASVTGRTEPAPVVPRHNSRRASWLGLPAYQLAEEGDRSATWVSLSQRRRSKVLPEMPSKEPAGRPPRPATIAYPVQSGGLPFVAVVQAADFRPHHDAAGRLDGAFRRRILAKREVRPRPLVVRHVGPKNSTEMPLIKDDDVVQTLAADRANDAFDVGILPGRARCRADSGETEGLYRPNAASKVRSRSWRRNRAFGSLGRASRSCCRVHADVGAASH